MARAIVPSAARSGSPAVRAARAAASASLPPDHRGRPPVPHVHPALLSRVNYGAGLRPVRFAVSPLSGNNPPAWQPQPRAVTGPSPPSTPLPAIERNLRAERAKRRARIEHDRERRAARRRFAFLLLLVVAVFFLALTILDQIRSLFGI